MEKQKCPELRFSQYKNDWYETTLGDVVDIVGGGTPDTNVSEFWNGDIDWYSPTEIGENVYANGSTKKITALGLKNSSAKILPAKKTVLFSSRAGIGDMAILDKPAATNQGFQSFVANNIDVYFLYSMGVKIKKFALSKASGSTFLEISRNQLAQMEFLAPSIDSNEQTQIGNFFQNLDQSIALHQKKLAQTQNLKKAMLEKMFPKAGSKQPEIRLKGFSGEWQLDAIGNVLQEVFRPINLDNETKYRLVTVKRRNGGIAERAVLKGKDILVKSQFEVKAGDYVISKRQVVHGATGLVPHELDGSIVSNEYLVGQSTDKLNIEFFALLSTLPEMYKKFFLSSYGVDIEKLFFDVNDWKKREILLPSLAEQIQISVFFKQLDETLALQQQQLQTLKNLKQAFLEKMFV
ncbi:MULTISPECIES: restriction endonuclease subunit S [Acinetobacter]|nr:MULTISPECIES: restriction endonuclease subunit S [Acinetobacter]QNX61139.1 restriction endonuclease subunit S [Acinetobacter seifertii]